MSVAPAQYKQIHSYLLGHRAIAHRAVTAGSTADAQEVAGVSIDRQADGSEPYASAMLVLDVASTLAAAETCSVAANLQDSTSGSTWTDLAWGDQTGSTSLTRTFGTTASTAAQTVSDVAAYPCDLSGAKRYVRCQFTPSISSTATDTAAVGGSFVFGGANILAAT